MTSTAAPDRRPGTPVDVTGDVTVDVTGDEAGLLRGAALQTASGRNP